MGAISVAAAIPAAAHVSTTSSVRGVAPNKVNMLDCNGWSKAYKSVNPYFKGKCVDPHGPLSSSQWGVSSAPGAKHLTRFVDNGHYVGHDEPSVKFISSAANSGNTMTYFMQMPKDPVAKATNNGKVVDYAELSPAPWFGLPLCDPLSYPESTTGCTPRSDTNSGSATDPLAANSAFMELQFYPPKFAPFADSVSCDATRWCAAMTIDSLEAQFNFANLNPNCTEPVNFAFLSRNGKPAGPPSPQLANGNTFKPNQNTLMINSGDVLKVSITDPPTIGFTTTVTDLTTHQTGWMTASAGNGFKDTINDPGQPDNCNGVAHTFHAEYNTAAQGNQVPWAALEGGVLMQQEIGHSEVCSSLANPFPVKQGSVIVDKKIFQTCNGGTEGANAHGEGPCSFTTGVCQHAMTQGLSGPKACPARNFAKSGALCEFSDGLCLPQGSRTVTINGHNIKETAPVNWCEQNLTQNGDLDFDGLSYRKDWPDGSTNHPTSFRYAGPFDQSGSTYPQIQFETDALGSEFLCNVTNGQNCKVPPLGAAFYPFWTLTKKTGQSVGHGLFPAGACIWNFGNVITNVTTLNLGKDAQYGVPDLARYGGTATSPVKTNPETNTANGCTALTKP
ncbi:MAG TPA: hypothetical protein VF834_20890 [Streptosporangiaceae bacterium]